MAKKEPIIHFYLLVLWRNALIEAYEINSFRKLISMYKLCFYVPELQLELVKYALFAEGAGQYKAYDQCCWQVRGEGQFRPLMNSHPYLGEAEKLEKVVEFKVEMICQEKHIKNVLNALISSHPYEEPAYEIYEILTIDDL
jgi:hypothetical protein